jgi:RNA polymerase sigma factor (sigma-70 family)
VIDCLVGSSENSFLCDILRDRSFYSGEQYEGMMPRSVTNESIEQYWDEVAAWLTRRTGDANVAADLTQEAYLRAAALPSNTVLINPRAWLFAAARNLLVDHSRRAKVRPNVGEDALAQLADAAPGADAVLLSREELAVLTCAVDALPPRTREVFRLHKFEGRSYAEIAAQLGIAQNTVMVHMVKALGLCREALQRHRKAEPVTNGSADPMRLPRHDC